MKLDKNVIEWACSLSGCDGGSLNAPIWISGIEWGGGDEEYYTKQLPEEIAKGKYTPSETYNWKDSLTYKYGTSLAKLITSYHGFDTSEYKIFAEKCTGNEIFKLNLYPIAFRSTSDDAWEKYNLPEIIGFQEKNLFKTWCFLHRFPNIAKIVEKYAPKIIICTGIDYLNDFFSCYARHIDIDTPINYVEVQSESENNAHKRRLYWSKINSKTTLCVIPFFSGAYGLNSDELLQKFGKKIRNIS